MRFTITFPRSTADQFPCECVRFFTGQLLCPAFRTGGAGRKWGSGAQGGYVYKADDQAAHPCYLGGYCQRSTCRIYGRKSYVDMEYMCSLAGKTEQEIYEELKGVIFLNPMYGYGNSTERKYLMADEYLSGNVREKLAWAKKSAEVYPEDYKINVEALEKVQPKDLTASEIFVQLGTTWLPEEIAQQFMYEFLDTPVYARWNIKIHYSKLTGEWNVEGKSYDRGNLKATIPMAQSVSMPTRLSKIRSI